MIGWWFIISTQTPEERDRAGNEDCKAAVLATWESSAGGIAWVNALLKEGAAITRSLNGGYPNRYMAPASKVLPLIANGPPSHSGMTIIGDDYVMAGNWIGRVSIEHDKMAACAPDTPLTIEVWDLS